MTRFLILEAILGIYISSCRFKVAKIVAPVTSFCYK